MFQSAFFEVCMHFTFCLLHVAVYHPPSHRAEGKVQSQVLVHTTVAFP